MSEDFLYEYLGKKAWELKVSYPKIPEYITNNLKYNIFEWQEEALEQLLTYQAVKNQENPNTPTHLMFNMATGSGKTLVMASCILLYYQKGYRHFLFFVNQNNIVDKTENNFIDPNHNKYLFTKDIVIGDKTVKIEEVESFSNNPENIEIKFTTIQQLYNDIHLERENRVVLNELDTKDIVMLGDEAHHLNTNTQKKPTQLDLDLSTEITKQTGIAEIERKGWEHTVIDLILHKRGKSSANVLLEFTATIPDSIEVQEKYKDKIIYKFDLKEFLSEGYTKEINLISSRFRKKERIIHALLFNWYREKIALKYYIQGNKSLANFKPVILFRSKVIEESWKDYNEFLNIVKNLTKSDFSFLNKLESEIYEDDDIYVQGKSRTRDIIEFIRTEGITYEEIIETLKYNFTSNKCIITNSEDNKSKTEKTDENKERLLNNLEDKDNNIRAIFTVKRLTEGWDVLNLFDIVRLYEGQNSGGSTNNTPKATTEEKQLIGRGVRYYPFSYGNHLINKRKFDDNPLHELRVLEELYYYTYDEESRYISHLKKELKREGYIKDNKVQKSFFIKEEFKNKSFFQDTVLWTNDRVENPNRRKKTLSEIKNDWSFQYTIDRFEFSEEEIKLKQEYDIKRTGTQQTVNKTLRKFIKDFDRHLLYKAISIKSKPDKSLLKFNNLSQELNIKSIDDLFTDDFLGDFPLYIIAPEETNFNTISNKEKLKILIEFFNDFIFQLKEYSNPYIGNEFTPKKFNELFNEPKIKIVEEDEESKEIASTLVDESWYILNDFNGTSEEKALVKDIRNTIANLETKYEDFYLLRNEEIYKIYDFKTGRGFQPDFILLLKDKEKPDFIYHIFIEPKGENLKEKDEWKNDFLKQITSKYSSVENTMLIEETNKYILIGLPLYNAKDKTSFESEYFKIWNS